MSVLLTNPHRIPTALLAAGAALLLGSCGGDDGPVQTTAAAVTGAEEMTTTDPAAPEASEASGPAPGATPADREAIAATLRSVLTGTAPVQVCETLVTERYVREAYGDRAGCLRAQAEARPASEASVGRIVILPASVAQASVLPRGGVYDGDRLRAELILDGDEWRLDSLRSNVPVGP